MGWQALAVLLLLVVALLWFAFRRN